MNCPKLEDFGEGILQQEYILQQEGILLLEYTLD